MYWQHHLLKVHLKLALRSPPPPTPRACILSTLKHHQQKIPSKVSGCNLIEFSCLHLQLTTFTSWSIRCIRKSMVKHLQKWIGSWIFLDQFLRWIYLGSSNGVDLYVIVSIVVDRIWRGSLISKHVALWCLFIDSHLTTPFKHILSMRKINE